VIEGDEGWVETHVGFYKDNAEIPEIPTETEGSTTAPAPVVEAVDNEEGEIPDMEEFHDDNIEDTDPAALQPAGDKQEASHILKTRKYDLSITYSKFYQTPMVWLFGYDENDNALAPNEVFMDVSQDHAHKTVTIDTHPHMQVSSAYIHPCKHAAVMKKIIVRQAECGKQPRVDQYMFLFLKFLSAVIPTIEYDYTMEIES